MATTRVTLTTNSYASLGVSAPCIIQLESVSKPVLITNSAAPANNAPGIVINTNNQGFLRLDSAITGNLYAKAVTTNTAVIVIAP